MSLEQDEAKGSRAEQLLKSDIYRDAYQRVRQGIIEKWSESPVTDYEGQHELRLMLKLLDDLNGNIVSMVNTGKLARKQIEHENKLKAAAKAALQGVGLIRS